ncbi:hypothetical protein ND748_18565 [Frankia sp. AiPs1]|uniref:hypothetical protein n=1 Tax=Frankia sp. AiPs1 TaxID=573493 RepID=UPI0020440370|nr:hypothetical protein [Frankia sp. AiPs1]MCM3923660.1 hypothetical protein [Frankia sp. AiPs1]
MRIRPSVVIALGLGYVLGSRGGREHYDVIMRQLREVRERPEVQSAAGVVSAQAGTVFHRVRSLFAGEVEAAGTGQFRPVAAHSSNGVSSVGAH